jgi:hypothetical protein
VFVGKDWKQPRNFGRDSWFPSRHETRRSQYVRSITVWPPAKHIIIRTTKFLMTAAGLFANYAFPPPHPRSALYVFYASSLNPSTPLLLQQSTLLPTGRLEYDVAWGLAKVLKEKGLAATLVSVTSFRILLLQFCINFFSFSSPHSSVGIPVGARVFISLLQNVRPGSWARPASH